MKWILRTLVLATAVSLPVLLAAAEPQDDAPNIESAQELLEAVARTYQSAPALTDTVTIKVPSRNGVETMTFDLLAGANGNAQLTAVGHNFLAVDGELFLSRESRPNKVVRLPLTGGRLLAMEPIATLRLPQLALRYGKTTEDYLAGMGMGLAADLQLGGRESVQVDGVTFEALLFSSNDAKVRVVVDPRTNLIRSVQVDGRRGVLDFQMNPTIHAKAPREIAYDPSEHNEVETLKQLALGVGDAAPDFTLATLDDEEVTLSDLCGSVVVLDFWASWCGPCKRGLPKLQEFANWAQEEGVDVKVYAINIGERVRGDDKRFQLVQQFWQKQGFSMPTLLDYDDEVAKAFEVGPIPHTVVIGPDGTLVKVQIGLDPAMVEALKKDTAEALDETG